MKPLRALSFRRFTTPSIADLVWAKSVTRDASLTARPASLKERAANWRRRPHAETELRWRLEWLATNPPRVRTTPEGRAAMEGREE